MHYGCWQFIIQTKSEQPDEEATYQEILDLQLRKDRCYTLIYTNISSDLKNLITEITDGVATWKILKDHFEPVTRARSTVQQIYRWNEEDFRVVKIEAELILEANRLQLMKQDLEKAENAYLSSFTRRSRRRYLVLRLQLMEIQMARMITKRKVIRTDGGLEFCNKDMDNFLTELGIKHEVTNSYTPEMNGIAERFNLTVLDGIKTLLKSSEVPHKFWGEALLFVSLMRGIEFVTKTVTKRLSKNIQVENHRYCI
ncbi:retrovirus-related Pol polyprotein from transposon TNT 1-94 [Trichonephila clavipes]|nr:retrovirus-related Pol polyprotein from transposon TNT 1-94 [Trichonephila clavipes]